MSLAAHVVTVEKDGERTRISFLTRDRARAFGKWIEGQGYSVTRHVGGFPDIDYDEMERGDALVDRSRPFIDYKAIDHARIS